MKSVLGMVQREEARSVGQQLKAEAEQAFLQVMMAKRSLC